MTKKSTPMNYLRHTLALCTVLAGLMVAPSAFSYQFISADRCPNGVTWSSSRQPLDYYINRNGSSTVPMNTVTRIFEDSFDAWSEPCCSSFTTNYRGTTSLTALNSDDEVVLSFQENNWPTQMGNVNQTIAVTLFQGYSNCTIYSAPILFNAVGFDFCSSGSGCTDLQSIATHEIGHNLGLDHSNHSDATMFYAYSGGTSARTLSDDDVAGVCALYPDTCACTRDSQCSTGQVCNNGQCEKAPCTSDAMCPGGKTCERSSGECVVPTCSTDNDCASGYICDATNHCVTECEICRECTSQADCGGGGAYCAAVDEGSDVGKCLASCGPDGSCPGDSECFLVPNSPASSGSCGSGVCESGEECVGDGNNGTICVTMCSSDGDCGSDQRCMDLGINVCVDTYQLCLNPDAGTTGTICPDGYECHSDSGGGSNPGAACNGLGNYCSTSSDNCTTDNDVCVGTSATEGYCSCVCERDSDCGDGATCETLQSGTKACIINDEEPTDPCDGVTCPSEQTCSGGVCVGGGTNPNDPDAGTSPDVGVDVGITPDIGGDSDAGDEVIDQKQEEEQNYASDDSDSGCGCSSTPLQDDVPGSLMLLGAFGLGILWRRKR
ncbi:matrixin family metalloprotease [Bradymonas sediminis]|uniref:Uncharacterized protein n=1 Tax=Bradymonas sediminis TaxID=1548548 RepID=A0A2Z4FP06_9DELT|nr:matrixin family metalloprotease [Bradymonas sediminis]AWV90486.1 hypothetical protein DN745_14570 [Bradymonas sediminis]TDP72125.1 uncharacterized protein (TIGR03382 family)/MYXO-CTERM domain-containing protein [Bradymonas sediminis]